MIMMAMVTLVIDAWLRCSFAMVVTWYIDYGNMDSWPWQHLLWGVSMEKWLWNYLKYETKHKAILVKYTTWVNTQNISQCKLMLQKTNTYDVSTKMR